MGALTSALPAGARQGVWIRQQATLATQARRAAADLARRIGLDARRQGEIELAVTEVAVNLNKHAVDGSLLLRLVDQTKLVTAASELARNTLSYGGGGTMSAEPLERAGRRGVRLRFADQGPGIPDLDLSLGSISVPLYPGMAVMHSL